MKGAFRCRQCPYSSNDEEKLVDHILGEESRCRSTSYNRPRSAQ